jgi:hypothetical protein
MHGSDPIVPLALEILVDKLDPGEYICELTGSETHGGQIRRVANFTVE